MNRTRLRINVFPSDIELTEIPRYDESIYGKTFSDENEIRVNEVQYGYAILYRDDVLETMNVPVLATNIVSLFTDNLQDTVTEIGIDYYHMGDMRTSCALVIMDLDEYFLECDNDMIEYSSSSSTDYISSKLHDDEDMEDDDDDEDDDYSSIDALFPSPKMKKKKYGQSRVMKSSKRAKKNIKRHGFLISSNKDARRKDKKIVQAFLKDFIPGNSRWIKEYRAEILVRWMDMYVVSKGVAKRMAKTHEEARRRRKSPIKLNKDVAVDLTKQLFRGYDPFYDPNR